ncbi:hypothetical protein MRBLMN1_006258 [Chitinophaga ginsengisegetis]|uniref:hypothetical protein n=1 Tax=Chitinophaga ginsengisegetis TaxID=393003 RepID=UPI0034332709
MAKITYLMLQWLINKLNQNLPEDCHNMNSNENLLSAYSFLAALTENENDLFNHVFIPICKRSLSLYSLKGKTHGTTDDIKQIILDNYGIDVPVVMVKKLLRSIEAKMSKSQKANSNFSLFAEGDNYTIEKYAFIEVESKYKKGERQARAIQIAFAAFIKSEEIDDQILPSFTDFLNKNKRRLAGFFKGDGHINGEPLENTYYHHIKFLEYIAISQQELYEIAESLYLGSIVAGFLEAGIDLEPKFNTEEVYYFDTPIVLKALGLQKEEDEKPIQELIQLITAAGGTIKILSITLEEIEGIINKSIESYNSSIPTTTINEACLRLKRNKAWLIKLNADLENRIQKELSISVEIIPGSFREKVANSPDVKALKDLRFKKGTAIHDVVAYLYVRYKRGTQVYSFQKAKAWFLTTNKDLLKFNIEKSPVTNCISEIVLPDALTSLLWLKNPVKFLNKVKSIGLTELMANTLAEEVPSKELISEFENNIRELKDVSEEDYHILLSSVAHQSAKRIESFIDKVASDGSCLQVEAQRIVEKEKSRRLNEQRKFKEIFKNENSVKKENEQLNIRLNEIAKKLEDATVENESTRTALEKLALEIETTALSRKKYKKKTVTGLIILLISIGCIYCVYHFELGSKLKSYIAGVVALSGLWGFISMILNSIKFLKDIKFSKTR